MIFGLKCLNYMIFGLISTRYSQYTPLNQAERRLFVDFWTFMRCVELLAVDSASPRNIWIRLVDSASPRQAPARELSDNS